MPFTVLDVRLSLGRIVLLCHDTVAERGGGKEIGGDWPLHFFTCMSNIKVTFITK